MGILRRFMRYFAKNTIKREEKYKTPCNPNAHWDRKQCKSCGYFLHDDTLCKCMKEKKAVKPLSNACKDYVKRKINARDLVYGRF